MLHVRMALGLIAMWVGCACIYLASHGMEARTPWEAFQTIMGRIGDA